MKRPIFSTNGSGESVIVGYEDTTTSKKEQAATEAGIKLAKEIGRERAARHEPLKSKLKDYLIGEGED